MKKQIFLLLAGTLLVGATNVAHAQRERPSRDERRETFRNQLDGMTSQQRIQFFQNRFDERLKTATPEERERMLAMRANMEQKIKDAGIDMNAPDAWDRIQKSNILQGMGGQNGASNAAADAMKQMMNAAGISDSETQNAVVAYVAEQNKARAGLFQLAKTAASALQTPAATPINVADGGIEANADSTVATTFKAYETAVQTENARQETALKELDAKINYSGKPRVKSFLTLVGILNNDVLAIGGPAAIFAPAPNGDASQTGTNGRMQN